VTLEDFVDQVRAGAVMVEGGDMVDGVCESRMVPLDPANVEGVTIEAYRAGAIGFEMEWAEALEQVRRLVG